jgi:hypothetical protein
LLDVLSTRDLPGLNKLDSKKPVRFLKMSLKPKKPYFIDTSGLFFLFFPSNNTIFVTCGSRKLTGND